MDKNSMLEKPFEYSTKMYTTSYETTLDERIEAAKKASSVSKQKHNVSERLCKKIAHLEKNTHSKNMTVKKTSNHAQEYKKLGTFLEPGPTTHFEHTNNAYSSNLIVPKNIYQEMINNSSSPLKSNNKGGGLMQRRLEALKQRTTSSAFNNSLESTNLSTNSLKQTYFKHPNVSNSNHTETSYSYRHEYKTRSSVQKNLNHEQNSQFGLSERCKNTSKTSVQNRLVKAKEEIKAKSKFQDKNYITKTEIVVQPTNELNRIYQDSNSLNYKNKIKRINQSGLSNKKNFSKKVISNNINEVINRQIVEYKQKPALLNRTLNVNETNSNFNESEDKLLESFSFAIPQMSSAQQQWNIKIKGQFTNDDFMEWEQDSMDWEPEPEQIVNTVNNFRKSNIEYEPMEWTPDTIMHCDKINLCLVVDTNILLSNLKAIILIIDTHIANYGQPTLMLPWQVLQELDFLKKKENALGYRSREATRWLLDTFSQCHPRLKGQPMVLKSSKNPDDNILECAISIKDRVNCICLVTDDKVLSVKSEVNKIKARNSVWLNNLIVHQKMNPEHSSVFQDIIANYPTIENQQIMICAQRLEEIILKILRFSTCHYKQLPSYFKNPWWKIYSLKPPLNLTKCLLALKDNWNVIALQQPSKPPLEQIEWLLSFFNDLQETSWQTSCWSEIYDLVKYCSEIINHLPYQYYDITDFFLNDLMVTRKMLKRKMDSSSTTSDDKSLLFNMSNNLKLFNNNHQSVNNTLLNILKTVETFCSNVYKASGIEHNMPKDEISRICLKNMYSRQKVDEFCYKLSNLIKNMTKIQKMDKEDILKHHIIIIDAFSKSIVELDSDGTELDKEKLTEYCLIKDKNMFLNVLVSFQNNLSKMKNLVTTLKIV